MKFAIVVGHLGLGDHIICNGLYRNLAEKYVKVIILCKTRNANSVARMIEDVENIDILPIPDLISNYMCNILSKLPTNLLGQFAIIKLGYFGKNFLNNPNIRYDENFYQQVQIDFNERWERFRVHRFSKSEDDLKDLLLGERGAYVFLHEDQDRGFVIDRKFIGMKKIIIEPVFNPTVNFFDYISLIENASEIHCIESSFCALIESLNLDVPKFAHRYARTEASESVTHEFTYRSKWNIITK